MSMHGIISGKSVVGNSLEEEKESTILQHFMDILSNLFKDEDPSILLDSLPTTTLPPPTTSGGIITDSERRVETSKEQAKETQSLLDDAFGGQF